MDFIFLTIRDLNLICEILLFSFKYSTIQLFPGMFNCKAGESLYQDNPFKYMLGRTFLFTEIR